jgi:hypothetical protein
LSQLNRNIHINVISFSIKASKQCLLLPCSIYSLTLKMEAMLFFETLGRAMAQTVSLWLPTAATRVRDRMEKVGFVVDKVTLGTGAGFLRVLRFPLSNIIPQISPSS